MLILPLDRYAEMESYLRADLSQERCGLLAGVDGRVTRVLPVPNSLGSPYAYRMDGPEFVEALKACDWEPLAIFHSHVSGPPVPSPIDVAQATYPDSYYIVISFHVQPPTVRAFSIVRGQVAEVDVQME